MRKSQLLSVGLWLYIILTASSAWALEPIQFIGATLESNMQYRYDFKADPTGMTDRSNLMVKGDYNRHTPVPMVKNPATGWWHGSITSYNKLVKFEISSNGAWFNGKGTIYWSDVDNSMVFGACDGVAYTKANMPLDPFPAGSTGDNVFRYIQNGLSVTAFLNLAYQSGGAFDAPFMVANSFNWSNVNATPVNSWGWASYVFTDVAYPLELRLSGGGHWSTTPADIDWVDITKSTMFYDAAMGNLKLSLDVGGQNMITLVSALTVTGGTEYVFRVDQTVAGLATPQVMGDFSWTPIPLTIDGSWHLAKVVSPENRFILVFGGNLGTIHLEKYVEEVSGGSVQINGSMTHQNIGQGLTGDNFYHWLMSKGAKAISFDGSQTPPVFTELSPTPWSSKGALVVDGFAITIR
ncbi:MAG: hypothetical protein WCK11_04315 [Candidatus Falkowbacteria bacterium]